MNEVCSSIGWCAHRRQRIKVMSSAAIPHSSAKSSWSKSAHVEGSCWKIALPSERCRRHDCLCPYSLFTWKPCYKMHRIKKETPWKRVMEMYVKSPSQEDSKVLLAHAHQAEFSPIPFVSCSVEGSKFEQQLKSLPICSLSLLQPECMLWAPSALPAN